MWLTKITIEIQKKLNLVPTKFFRKECLGQEGLSNINYCQGSDNSVAFL